MRLFDLRHLEHSTILYEDATHRPLLRLAWNKQDFNYLATFAMEAQSDPHELVVLDGSYSAFLIEFSVFWRMEKG